MRVLSEVRWPAEKASRLMNKNLKALPISRIGGLVIYWQKDDTLASVTVFETLYVFDA